MIKNIVDSIGVDNIINFLYNIAENIIFYIIANNLQSKSFDTFPIISLDNIVDFPLNPVAYHTLCHSRHI